MLTYYLYFNAMAIKNYDDIDDMRTDVLELVEFSYLKNACYQNITKQIMDELINTLRTANDISFWRIIRENFGYYYKTR